MDDLKTKNKEERGTFPWETKVNFPILRFLTLYIL